MSNITDLQNAVQAARAAAGNEYSENADRAKAYQILAKAYRSAGADFDEGYKQLLMQTQITTYSDVIGGGDDFRKFQCSEI